MPKKKILKYNHKAVEKKWQKVWDAKKLHQAKDFDKRPKFYTLIEFPYPSGDGLHVGHVRSYTAIDAVARHKRMEGYNVLYPIGFDAFGLPAENFAIRNKIHPKIATQRNIKNFTRQLKSLGLSFDWKRVVDTTDPEYYKWTQWIFLQLYKAGMAYRAEIPINWCPKCKTGLANEEVVDGKHERCGTPVEKKLLKQWLIKITKYAERLIEDLKLVNFPERVKIQQTNWIGRSEGALIEFPIKHLNRPVEVFTTRPDTIYGASYLVLSPEHELIPKIKDKISNYGEVENYIVQAGRKTEQQRTTEEKEKTGVRLEGVVATNPATSEEIPVFIADYVLTDYGTGAIMAVPAHDTRDFAFAKKYDLPIVPVIKPADVSLSDDIAPAAATGHLKVDIESECWVGDGIMINSGKFNGKESDKVRRQMAEQFGKIDVKYKLRDWVFSRQHYWGEPIPIIYCEKCGEVSVPEEDLPVLLPKVKNYEPTETGESPLAAIKKFVETRCPVCREKAKRETDTMPNWAGSNWYFIRYTDPKNKKAFADRKKMDYWLPVDLYNGGMEHTTLHLLYSRFIYKFLSDQKLVPGVEPYSRRTSHGIVLAEDGRKMSKSFGNVVNPDVIVKEFGADTLRLYELFIAPFSQMVPWNTQGVVGVRRFIDRVYSFFQSKPNNAETEDERKLINRLIKKITSDLAEMKFNTAVAAFMESLNGFEKAGMISKETSKKFLILLAPFAPHLAEELWQRVSGRKTSVHQEKWPDYDPAFTEDRVVNIVVQINGKVRGNINAEAGAAQEEVENLAQAEGNVSRYLAGHKVKKVIYVQGRIINFVID